MAAAHTLATALGGANGTLHRCCVEKEICMRTCGMTWKKCGKQFEKCALDGPTMSETLRSLLGSLGLWEGIFCILGKPL